MARNVCIVGFNQSIEKGITNLREFASRISRKNYKGYNFFTHFYDMEESDIGFDTYSLIEKQRAHMLIFLQVKNMKNIRIETQASNKKYQETDPNLKKKIRPLSARKYHSDTSISPDVFDNFKNKFSTNIPMNVLAKIKKTLSFPSVISKNAGMGDSNKLYYYMLQSVTPEYYVPTIMIHVPSHEFEYDDYVDLIHSIVDNLEKVEISYGNDD